MMLGPKPFIRKATHFRKLFGAGMRQAGVVTSAARVALQETFYKLHWVHDLATSLAAELEREGARITLPVDTCMVSRSTIPAAKVHLLTLLTLATGLDGPRFDGRSDRGRDCTRSTAAFAVQPERQSGRDPSSDRSTSPARPAVGNSPAQGRECSKSTSSIGYHRRPYLVLFRVQNVATVTALFAKSRYGQGSLDTRCRVFEAGRRIHAWMWSQSGGCGMR